LLQIPLSYIWYNALNEQFFRDNGWYSRISGKQIHLPISDLQGIRDIFHRSGIVLQAGQELILL
jgi:hypothetical protein